MGVQGVLAVFTEAEEFLNFLLSPDSNLLWTDTEEILAMCNQYQMEATVIKVSANEDDQAVVLEVRPDPDILKLGLPDTALIPADKLPRMLLLLQGAHYDLVLPEASILDRFIPQEKEGKTNDGYNVKEEEEEDPPTTAPKSAEDKLKDMETKYSQLKGFLEEVFCRNSLNELSKQ